MTSIATVRVGAENFLLESTFRAVPEGTVEVPPVVAQGPDDPFPFVVATGVAASDLDAAFEEDESVREAERLSTLDPGGLYRITWSETPTLLLGAIERTDTTVLSVRGTEGSWCLRVLTPTRDRLGDAFDFLATHDIDVELDDIRRIDPENTFRPFGLSDEQHTALLAGLERGFYDVPRAADTSELADELEITHQALSERLRRGHGSLVANALASGSRVFN